MHENTSYFMAELGRDDKTVYVWAWVNALGPNNLDVEIDQVGVYDRDNRPVSVGRAEALRPSETESLLEMALTHAEHEGLFRHRELWLIEETQNV